MDAAQAVAEHALAEEPVETPAPAPPPQQQGGGAWAAPSVPLPSTHVNNERYFESQQQFVHYNNGFNDGYVRGYYSGMNTMAASVNRPHYHGRGRGRGRGRGGGYPNQRYDRTRTETPRPGSQEPNSGDE